MIRDSITHPNDDTTYDLRNLKVISRTRSATPVERAPILKEALFLIRTAVTHPNEDTIYDRRTLEVISRTRKPRRPHNPNRR